VIAISEDEISQALRDITIMQPPPIWITDDEYTSILNETGFDVLSIPDDHWLYRFVIR
jgi:hypothetical protein